MNMMEMTSRQRLMNALEFKPTDRVPLLLRFWSLGGDQDNIPFAWRDEIKRVEATLKLGLDDTIMLQPPLGYVEAYIPEKLPTITSHIETLPAAEGEDYPRLKKVYETPDGPLQTIGATSGDWPFGDDIHLFEDHNIPRMKEPLVKTYEDISKLHHLLGEPDQSQIEQWQEHAAHFKAEAERLQVVLDGGWVALGDAAMWLVGMERVLYGQLREPDFIAALLDVILEWELRRIDLLLEAGVDVIVHMAWYESTDFWTPRVFRKLIKPRLRQEIEKVHAAGRKFRYIITKSWKPYIDDLMELGIDCLTGIDPVQDNIDLADVKATIGQEICLMGGLNSAVMFSQWADDQIKTAAEQAIEIMAPAGGFIGYPVDAVFNTQPWKKIETFLEHWRQISHYT